MEITKKRKSRVTRACDSCRLKRIKCDGQEPCQVCQQFDRECSFQTPQRKRGPPKRNGESTDNDLFSDSNNLNNFTSNPSQNLNDINFLPTTAVANSHNFNNVFLNSDIDNLPTSLNNNNDFRNQIMKFPSVLDPTIPLNIVYIGQSNGRPLSSLGKFIFFGGSTSALSNVNKYSPRYSNGNLNLTVTMDIPDYPHHIKTELNKYDKSLHSYLCAVYFKHIHPLFPMVDESWFFPLLENESSDENFLMLLYAICALVTQQMTSKDLAAFEVKDIISLHMEYFHKSRYLIGRLFDLHHLEVVQTGILLSLIGLSNNAIANSFIFIGIAHRVSIELGMHFDLDKIDLKVDEKTKNTMKQTWTCLFIVDKYVSLCEGRPVCIRDDGMINTATWKFLKFLEFFYNIPSAELQVHFHLASLMGKIAKIALVAYIGQLPIEQYQVTPNANLPWSFHDILWTMYHCAQILIERLKGARVSNQYWSSSVAILRAMQKVRVKPLNSYRYILPIVVYSNLTSCSFFLETVIMSSNCIGMLELWDSIQVFDSMNKWCFLAGFYQQITSETMMALRIPLSQLEQDKFFNAEKAKKSNRGSSPEKENVNYGAKVMKLVDILNSKGCAKQTPHHNNHTKNSSLIPINNHVTINDNNNNNIFIGATAPNSLRSSMLLNQRQDLLDPQYPVNTTTSISIGNHHISTNENFNTEIFGNLSSNGSPSPFSTPINIPQHKQLPLNLNQQQNAQNNWKLDLTQFSNQQTHQQLQEQTQLQHHHQLQDHPGQLQSSFVKNISSEQQYTRDGVGFNIGQQHNINYTNQNHMNNINGVVNNIISENLNDNWNSATTYNF
ncbi:hypothetical protein HDU92_008580 [Lobulomyces angularis]|nr:hypothetical protein HDU92_008580 [Lobulomyces angularis]